MHSSNLFVCILPTLLILSFIAYSIQPIKSEGSFELSIIHFSDFHSRYDPVSLQGGLCYDKKNCIGGIARVATIVNRLKASRPNALFLNAGDSFQGTLYYELFRGNITAQFLNLLPHDAITIGNHDFDDGISGLAYLLKNLQAPVVDSNIDISGEPDLKNCFTNSVIIQRGDKKIGIIGVIFSDTDKISETTGNVKFLKEIESVNLEANELKAKNVEIIIVLSHSGIEPDKLIAANCPNVDVIVGGHSHIFLYNGKLPSGDIAYGPYPIVVNQDGSNRKVVIVHSGPFTKYMGDIKITFDERGEVTQWEGNPIYLDNTIKEDEKILEELKPWKAAMEEVGKQLIGRSKVFLNGTCYYGDCNLANLITDAMVDHYSDYSPISITAAINIQNSIPAGPIFYEDIYMCLPYNNTWSLIEMRGRDLLKVIEENVKDDVVKNDKVFSLRLLHWSGMVVKYNLQNKGSKVVDVKIRCQNCKDKEYEDLEESKIYRIVVPKFLLTIEFKTIYENHKMIVSGTINDYKLLLNYIKKIQVVDEETEPRMIFI